MRRRAKAEIVKFESRELYDKVGAQSHGWIRFRISRILAEARVKWREGKAAMMRFAILFAILLR